MPTSRLGVYYDVQGESGPTVLLVAGLGSDARYWSHLVKLLSASYKVITVDNRDSGRSFCAKSSYTTSDMAGDLIDLLDELSLDNVHVLGHSMGGAIAQYMILKAPERFATLILSATFLKVSAFTRHIIESAIRFRLQVTDDVWLMASLPWSYTEDFFTDTEFVNEFVEGALSDPYPQVAKAYTRQAEACLEHDTRTNLSEVHTPTLVVTGESDLLSTVPVARAIAEEVQGALCEVIPKAGHAAPIEFVQDFARVVTQFWRKHAG